MRVHDMAPCVAVAALVVLSVPDPSQATTFSPASVVCSLPDGTAELVARRHAFRGGGFRGGSAGRRL